MGATLGLLFRKSLAMREKGITLNKLVFSYNSFSWFPIIFPIHGLVRTA